MYVNKEKSIPSQAFDMKKVNKTEAFATLTKVIRWSESLCDSDKTGVKGNDLAKLYNYFLPPLPKKPKDNFQWVAKGLGINDIREYLNAVWLLQNGDLVASNGHVIHLVSGYSKPLDKGITYNKIGGVIELGGKFPDIYRVVEPTKNLEITIVLKDAIIELMGKEGKDWFILVNGLKINKTYWDNAVMGFDSDKALFSYTPNSLNPIKIEQDNKIFIVMPCKQS